jgi:hypothetical protein
MKGVGVWGLWEQEQALKIGAPSGLGRKGMIYLMAPPTFMWR